MAEFKINRNMKNLKDKLQKAAIEAADEYINEKTQEYTQNERDNTLVTIGAIGAIDKLATNLSANSMRALIHFQQSKSYKTLGYANFVEFLESSPYAPMTKNQFYDRNAVLEKEGDGAFDFFNSLDVSISKRKLLGKGAVEIEGEKVFVRDDSGNAVELDITDRRGIVEAISALADANQDKAGRIETTEKQRDKFKDGLLKAEEKINEIRAEKSVAVEVTYSASLVAVLSAIANLAAEAQKLTIGERQKMTAPTFEEIQGRLNLLRSVLGSEPQALAQYSDEKLNDDELMKLML